MTLIYKELEIWVKKGLKSIFFSPSPQSDIDENMSKIPIDIQLIDRMYKDALKLI